MLASERLSEPCVQARAAEQMGVSRQSVGQWIDKFVRQPILAAGLRPPESISVQQLWAVLIARSLMQQGESNETATSVCNFLSSLSPASVEAAFAAGRCCILIVNGEPIPRLSTPEAVCGPQVRKAEELALANGVDARLLRINVQPLLIQILDGAASEDG